MLITGKYQSSLLSTRERSLHLHNPICGRGCINLPYKGGGAIEISNKVQAIAGLTLSAFWPLTGFAWQVLQTDGSEHLPSILARNFLAASF